MTPPYIYPELRDYQLPTLEAIKTSSEQLNIIYAPTGSGKSFFPEQLAYEGFRVLANVATKSLQAQYNLFALYGKANYSCLKQVPLFGDNPSADNCHLADGERSWCFENCPYPLAKEEFLSTNGGVVNYPKFLLDSQLIEEYNPDFLFLDEAHTLSDTVLSFAGLEFFWKSKQLAKYSPGTFPIGLPQPMAYSKAFEWLKELLANMNANKPQSPNKGGKTHVYKWHRNKKREIASTLNFMHSVPESWYIEATREGLLIKPLTARFNFLSLFDKAEKIVLMSATIDRHTLRELGIKNYKWIEVPNKYPTPMRPIIDLKCPRMGYNSSDSDKDTQARIIAHSLSQRPCKDTGLIHVSSKAMAKDLAYRLGKFSKRRLFVPDFDASTEDIYNDWLNVKNDGTQIIYWSMWEGWNCGKDSINIIAKVPFVNLSDGYDKARFFYDGKAGFSRVAAKFVQGLGRVRRGIDSHYGNSKLVAIADGNWTRIKSYLPKDLGIIS